MCSLVVAFGLDLSEEQVAALVGLAPIVAAAGTWLLGRRGTTPWSEVVATVDPLGSDVAVAGPAADVPTGAAVDVTRR